MPGMKATMGEFKRGKLRSGSKTGPKVTSRKQAIAIGLSEQADAVDAERGKHRGKPFGKGGKRKKKGKRGKPRPPAFDNTGEGRY